MISVRTLCKSHGGRKVLERVTADVAKGETIAIVGPSGGGKSTLLRCLNNLETFDEGSIEICGFKLHPGHVARETLRKMRVHVGMVFQQFNLFPHLSAIDNIILAPTVVKKQSRAEATERGLDLLGKVGLRDRASAFPHELSGGQQQRVAIARALAQQPDVMLFDEPTSALDPEMRDDVMEVIQGLARTEVTMLVITHEMQFAHDVATRVWVIDKGTIAEDGPPSQVVDDPQSNVAREFFARLRK